MQLDRAWRMRDKASIREASVVTPLYLGLHRSIPLDWGDSVIAYLQTTTKRRDMGLGLIWYLNREEAEWRAVHKAGRHEVMILFQATYVPGTIATANESVVKLARGPIIQDCYVLRLDGTWCSQLSDEEPELVRELRLVAG